MEFKTVFIVKEIADNPITNEVLKRIPNSQHIIVNERTFHRIVAQEIIDCGLLKFKDTLPELEYIDLVIKKLGYKFHEEVLRFVCRAGINPVGTLERGEVCGLAKSYLILSYADIGTLIKPSVRYGYGGKKEVLCCNYTQLNPTSSCPYQCMYCFESELRGKQFPFMRFYVNYKEVFSTLKEIDQGVLPRNFKDNTEKCWFSVNMGEHADSLAQDNIFRILPIVVDWFHQFKNLRLLLLSKGGNPDLLPENPPTGKVAFTISINTNATSKALEIGTPSPKERLMVLRKAYEKGYMTAIRIDPLIAWPENWKEEVEQLVDLISTESPKELSEITIGSMRFRPKQASLFKQISNSNRIETPIGGLYSEHVNREAIEYLYSDESKSRLEKGFSDGYYRLPFEERKNLYSHIVSLIKQKRPNLRVTLCQEEVEMYKQVDGVSMPGKCNCMVANW